MVDKDKNPKREIKTEADRLESMVLMPPKAIELFFNEDSREAIYTRMRNAWYTARREEKKRRAKKPTTVGCTYPPPYPADTPKTATVFGAKIFWTEKEQDDARAKWEGEPTGHNSDYSRSITQWTFDNPIGYPLIALTEAEAKAIEYIFERKLTSETIGLRLERSSCSFRYGVSEEEFRFEFLITDCEGKEHRVSAPKELKTFLDQLESKWPDGIVRIRAWHWIDWISVPLHTPSRTGLDSVLLRQQDAKVLDDYGKQVTKGGASRASILAGFVEALGIAKLDISKAETVCDVRDVLLRALKIVPPPHPPRPSEATVVVLPDGNTVLIDDPSTDIARRKQLWADLQKELRQRLREGQLPDGYLRSCRTKRQAVECRGT